MNNFDLHRVESAPEGSKPLMEAVVAKYGFLPNLTAVMAESPALLAGYLGLYDAFSNSTLTPVEQQIVLLTVSRLNGCEYCVAAHSVIADMNSVPEQAKQAIRDDKPVDDLKLDALRRFTASVVTERGWVGKEAVDALLAEGYTKQTVFDVLVGVAVKTMSNYTNHIAGTPLDEAFATQSWENPATE